MSTTPHDSITAIRRIRLALRRLRRRTASVSSRREIARQSIEVRQCLTDACWLSAMAEASHVDIEDDEDRARAEYDSRVVAPAYIHYCISDARSAWRHAIAAVLALPGPNGPLGPIQTTVE